MPSIEVLRNRYHELLSQRGGWQNDETPEIKDCLETFASEHLEDGQNYETQICSMFESFDHRVHPDRAAEAIGCSPSYVRRFDYDPDPGEAFEKDWSKQNQKEKVSPGKRDRIIRRDNTQCLRCREDSSLEIHHIIPVSTGGEDQDRNLATLCEECHVAAHGGSKTDAGVIYDDRTGFQEWLNTEPHPAETNTGQLSLSDYE